MTRPALINADDDAQLALKIITEVLEVYEERSKQTLTETHLAPEMYEKTFAERNILRRVIKDARKIYNSAVKR